jgi:hypothetical protein
MWGLVREALSQDPRAKKLHSHPDVFSIPNFFTDAECDHALGYAGDRLAAAREEEAEGGTKWCFEKHPEESDQNKTEALAGLQFDDENPDAVSKRQLAGLYRCADGAIGLAYAKKHGYTSSTAVLATDGEDRIFDGMTAKLQVNKTDLQFSVYPYY